MRITMLIAVILAAAIWAYCFFVVMPAQTFRAAQVNCVPEEPPTGWWAVTVSGRDGKSTYMMWFPSKKACESNLGVAG